jgi:hypothetical protein
MPLRFGLLPSLRNTKQVRKITEGKGNSLSMALKNCSLNSDRVFRARTFHFCCFAKPDQD